MKKALIAFLLFLLVAPLFPLFAQKLDSNERIILTKDQVVDSSYFAAGESVTLSGTIEGDAYVAGGRVLIEGTVNGDLLIAGGTVSIRGNVAEDIRVVGGKVDIAGAVGGNVTVAGGDISVDDSAKITGELVVGGGNVEIYAPIGGSLIIGGGEVLIANRVGGNVLAGVGQLELSSNAVIDGDLTYYAEQEATIQDGAQITGKVNFKKSDFENQAQDRAGDAAKFAGGAWISYKIFSAITALIIGLIFFALFPVFFSQAADNLNKNFWWSMLIGFITLIVLPVAAVLIMLTIVGIPIGFLLFFGLAFAIYFSKIIVAFWIGRRILVSRAGKNTKIATGWSLALGLLIWVIATSIPIIGGIVSFVVITTGLGTLISQKRNTYLSLRAKKLI